MKNDNVELKTSGSMKIKLALFRFIVLLMIITISAVLGEILLRVIVYYDLFGENNGFTLFMKQYKIRNERVYSDIKDTGLFRLCDDTDMGWEPIPGVSAGHININSAGFRGEEYDKSVPQGTIRVVLLGDSEVFGLLLRKDETLSGNLEHFLNAYSENEMYEVLNFGVPGYNTAQEFEVLKRKAIHFNPSIVIIYYVLNDPLITNPVILIKGRVVSRSYLYLASVFLIKSYAIITDMQKEASSLVDFYQRLHSSEYFLSFKRLLEKIGNYTEKRGIRLFLIIAPPVIGFEEWEDYPYKNIHEKLKQLSSKNVEVIDPFDDISSKVINRESFGFFRMIAIKTPKQIKLLPHSAQSIF